MSTISDAKDLTSNQGQQLNPRPTRGQIAFDIAFGFALPLICLYFDPIVFRPYFGRPVLGSYVLVGGVAIFLGLLTLPAWIFFRRPAALFAGLLAGGAIFAALLGVVLLPYSLVGLMFFIGVLGFSPFLTASVFWRNALQAYQQAFRGGNTIVVLALVMIGLMVTCVGPWVAHGYVTRQVSQAMKLAVSTDPVEAEEGVSVLRTFRPFANLDAMVYSYLAESDEGQRERIASAYRESTGEPIEHRLGTLID